MYACFLVWLVAVSKFKSVHDIKSCYDAGQRNFGENYIKELVEKSYQLPSDIMWHFIGTFQSNKAKSLAGILNFFVWETCSSVKHAISIDQALRDNPNRKQPLKVFVQVNTSGEKAKGGCAVKDCKDVVEYVLRHSHKLQFSGLMTIGRDYGSTLSADNEDFLLLLELRREICTELGLDSSTVELSMGMSSDFEHAIKLGSTNVRVGSLIFGSR
ncbi:hypothetical protein Zmor_027048 [Zophobas morio]|uniref:Pyridoxal phosphate homeostasis protein n=1 Tax=Zophobas morio TaxID=2755281 RepID=A0AA38HJA5_9CUCU|nr:hypothetical protein Zmor_027048 [Zophobas morio]